MPHRPYSDGFCRSWQFDSPLLSFCRDSHPSPSRWSALPLSPHMYTHSLSAGGASLAPPGPLALSDSSSPSVGKPLRCLHNPLWPSASTLQVRDVSRQLLLLLSSLQPSSLGSLAWGNQLAKQTPLAALLPFPSYRLLINGSSPLLSSYSQAALSSLFLTDSGSSDSPLSFSLILYSPRCCLPLNWPDWEHLFWHRALDLLHLQGPNTR